MEMLFDVLVAQFGWTGGWVASVGIALSVLRAAAAEASARVSDEKLPKWAAGLLNVFAGNYGAASNDPAAQ
jgi:hypothetical protein